MSENEKALVSRRTVVKIKAELLPPEVVNLADKYAKEIVDNLKTLAVRGVANSLAKIDDLTAKDSMIVAAMAIDKAQLLTSNPTSIVQTNIKDEQFYLNLLLKLFTAQNTDAPQATIEEMLNAAIKYKLIPAEFVAGIERKLLAGSKT